MVVICTGLEAEMILHWLNNEAEFLCKIDNIEWYKLQMQNVTTLMNNNTLNQCCYLSLKIYFSFSFVSVLQNNTFLVTYVYFHFSLFYNNIMCTSLTIL